MTSDLGYDVAYETLVQFTEQLVSDLKYRWSKIRNTQKLPFRRKDSLGHCPIFSENIVSQGEGITTTAEGQEIIPGTLPTF